MYSREDEIGWRQSTAFKKAFSIDVDIELVGVWYVHLYNFFPSHNLANYRYPGTQSVQSE